MDEPSAGPIATSGAAALARTLWETKYRFAQERTVEDSWRRISPAVAAVEGDQAEVWAGAFEDLMRDFRFLPGGRIQAAAGTAHEATLFNCFVMGPLSDAEDRPRARLRPPE